MRKICNYSWIDSFGLEKIGSDSFFRSCNPKYRPRRISTYIAQRISFLCMHGI